jgi:hypothetical protein
MTSSSRMCVCGHSLQWHGQTKCLTGCKCEKFIRRNGLKNKMKIEQEEKEDAR